MTGNPEYRIEFGREFSSRGWFSISLCGSGQTRRYAYEIDDTRLEPNVSKLPAAVIDAVDILRMLSLIDRVAPRTFPGDSRPIKQRGPRQLVASFPVRDLRFWQTSHAQRVLHDLVWSLGHDYLEPAFVSIRTRSRTLECQQRLPLFDSAAARTALLLSPGMDSLYGLIHSLNQRESGDVLAVSVWTHSRHLAAQQQIIRSVGIPIIPRSLRQAAHAPVKVSLTPDKSHRESSQRLRVLSFLASGALGAIGIGQDRLVLAENGPGAINLSSSYLLGSPHLNRSMHPSTLKTVAELFALALSKPFFIENVGLPLTKRQMVSQMIEDGFKPLIGLTVSCDRYPYTPGDHCGRCSSCLFRALALLDHPELFNRIGNSKHSQGRRLADIARADAYSHLLLLGARLDEALQSPAPLRHLAVLDERLSDVLNNVEMSTLLALLTAFRNDIQDLECVVSGEPIEPLARTEAAASWMVGS